MPVSINNTTLTFNDGTTMTTAATGGVTSLNGATGAITNTGLDAIGSYAWLANCSTSNLFAGNTIAGSNLRYASTITQAPDANFPNFTSEGTFNTNPQTIWDNGNNTVNKPTFGNPGFQNPNGTTAVSGTWRAMNTTRSRSYTYNGESNTSNSISAVGLFVRVS